ncbi:hypothetical protein, partial [Enterococcus faecium]
MVRKLQPGSGTLKLGEREFIAAYWLDVLAPLDPRQVVADLERIGGGRDVALACWEPPQPGPSWCHRSLISVFLMQ